MTSILDQISLWLQQHYALYWFLPVLLVLLVAWAANAVVNRKRVQRLNRHKQELALVTAGNQQLIENLTAENADLKTQLSEARAQHNTLLTHVAELKTSREEKLAQLQAVENERNGLREMAENSQRKISHLEADMREQQAKLDSEKEKLVDMEARWNKSQEIQANQFKSISERIIKDRQEALSKQNTEGVGALLKPLQAQIAGFQQRVNEVHSESIKGNATLKNEIESVMKMGIQMRDEANNLTTALKGDTQQRGAWGEAQLERTLELSGLIAGDHYDKQSTFVDDQGNRKQTDYLVKLPDDKCILIDSKVSLIDYERACSGEPDQLTAAMKQHVKAVRKHMDDLANKDYTNLPGLHSPDFILMFMPVEPAYIEAMKQDPNLFGYGYQKNIIMVSHTTLIPILRTVANLWMLERSNKEARQLGDAANDIYNSVAIVSERLDSLGKTLGTASKHFNQTVTALSGKQGLQGKVRRFTELSSKASKKMPELEHKHHEFETNRLELEAVEPDPENSSK